MVTDLCASPSDYEFTITTDSLWGTCLYVHMDMLSVKEINTK